MAVTLRKKRDKDVEPYYPEGEDPDDTNATCFLMKDLKPKEEASVKDGLAEMDQEGNVSKVKSQTITIELIEKKMQGWRNVFDENGDEVKPEDIDVETLLWKLPDDIEQELYSEFGLGQGVEEDEDDEE